MGSWYWYTQSLCEVTNSAKRLWPAEGLHGQMAIFNKFNDRSLEGPLEIFFSKYDREPVRVELKQL